MPQFVTLNSDSSGISSILSYIQAKQSAVNDVFPFW